MFVLMVSALMFQDHDIIGDSWRGSCLTAEQYKAWQIDGVYPEYFDIEIHRPTYKAPPISVAVPLDVLDVPVEDNSARWSQFTGSVLHNAFKDKREYDAMILLDIYHEKTRIPWDHVELQYLMRAGSAFPLPDGHVYRASFGNDLLRLTNVDGAFTDAERPNKSSLTIAGNCQKSRYPQGILKSDEFGRIVVSMAVDKVEFSAMNSGTATVSWHRYDKFGKQVQPDQWAKYHALFKMPEKGVTTMTKGEQFFTGYRRYEIRNVVPPRDLPGAGHCEGWIELKELERPKPNSETSPVPK